MILLGLGEGVKPNPNIVRIVNTIDIYGPSVTNDIKVTDKSTMKKVKSFYFYCFYSTMITY